MSNILVELTANIVASHAGSIEMTTDELLKEIQQVYSALRHLDTELPVEEPKSATPNDTSSCVSPKKSIQKDQVICLVCNKGGFKTLSRHLKLAHNMKPSAYRKQFGIPAGTVLAAKSYSESRRKAALSNNLGEKLSAGRMKYQAQKAAEKAEANKSQSKTQKTK